MEKYAAIILAAGKGTRMNEGLASPIPKVMFELLGKPIIEHSVNAVEAAGVKKIVLVVGYKKELVMEHMDSRVEYAVQEEQLGTGHAAAMAKGVLKDKAESIIVFYGDNPLYKPETIRRLIEVYENPSVGEKPTVAMLSVNFDNPIYWVFGRIIRDSNGEVIGITEQKDCNEEELKIKECNPGFYIFDARWFWENIDKLETNNAQKELYLTDMIKIAKAQNKRIIAIPVSEESEALGINTQEQLKQAEEVLQSRIK